MKKIFTILLLCCAAFAYANDEPIFEETDEKTKINAFTPFAAEEPFFEDDNETNACNKCKDPSKKHETDQHALLKYALRLNSQGENTDPLDASYVSWPRYKANFGIESLLVRFPQRPIISQSNTLLTAYAYDNGIMYLTIGYFPPVGSVNPAIWFDEIAYSLNRYPCSLVSSVVSQDPNGVWIMDYVAHDCIKNLIIKSRAIVTPFNCYQIQCIKPNGARDYFGYFVDNFFIRCSI